MPGIITLTTDFGLEGPFAGIMKGVILSINPSARIVDITHGIEPQNIEQAACVIEAAWRWFPKSAVHLAVVDPGVGGNRRALAFKKGRACFVGPDNGLFTGILDSKTPCHELANPKYRLPEVSGTFHGRDVFAPAAAWIARGTSLKSLGPRLEAPVLLDRPQPVWTGKALEGRIVYIDRFGNAATNISRDLIAQYFPHESGLTVKIGKRAIGGLATHYAEVTSGRPGALINSWNVLELFVRDGHAARSLRLKAGQTIRVTD